MNHITDWHCLTFLFYFASSLASIWNLSTRWWNEWKPNTAQNWNSLTRCKNRRSKRISVHSPNSVFHTPSFPVTTSFPVFLLFTLSLFFQTFLLAFLLSMLSSLLLYPSLSPLPSGLCLPCPCSPRFFRCQVCTLLFLFLSHPLVLTPCLGYFSFVHN